jgi:Protein of unknown function (DUF2490)
MPDCLQRIAKWPLIMMIVVFNAIISCIGWGQSSKEVNQQAQFWWSLNTTTRLTNKFGFVGDVHLRRNNFLKDPSFYLIRFGPNFWITDEFTLTLGYARVWRAPSQEDWHTWTNEDRIYEQIQYTSKIGKTSVLQRLRNEQRWQQQVENDMLTGEMNFSNRVRYLLSFTIPVSKKPALPLLVLSDEIMVQFGSSIVLNTFDQNRFFAGIKKNLSPSWSFDLGYMPVYQQKSSGYQYDLNHTLRWFFYFTPDLRKSKSPPESTGNEE